MKKLEANSFYIETYGCTSNKADSYIISNILQKTNYVQTSIEKAEKKKTGKAPAKKKVVKKKEEKEEEAEEFICPYCGKVLKEKLATCPDCSASLKF